MQSDFTKCAAIIAGLSINVTGAKMLHINVLLCCSGAGNSVFYSAFMKKRAHSMWKTE